MHRPLAALAAALPLFAAAPLAHAADRPRADSAPCFFITQWRGWKAPSPDVIYLGVNNHDVYRADLSAGSPELQWPDARLINQVHGPDSICSALDLQLEVSDGHGFRQGLIVKDLVKLTPDQVAAIPKKFNPN